MLRVVRVGTRVAINESVLQGAVHQNRELARSGRDGLGLARAEREAAACGLMWSRTEGETRGLGA